MARLKQKIRALRNAESEYNKRFVALNKEFTSEMHNACKEGNMDYFEALKEDYRKYFGEAGELSIISIEILYGLNLKQ